MKKFLIVILSILFFSNAYAFAWTGNINLFIGKKLIPSAASSDPYLKDQIEDLQEFGLMFDFKKTHWPISITFDFLISNEKKTGRYVDFERSESEYGLGICKTWTIQDITINPYIGCGLALIERESQWTDGDITSSGDDSNLGYWIKSGVYYTLSQHFHFGIEARYSLLPDGLNIFEQGNRHFGAYIGYHW